ncbi:hypothetical protein PoB_005583000 [Plakobranchus ocellatus]|uniref:Uncharacterized protein n=1 Tax=Plakobranchus ocellatus TaxID=259542 RepID=A0AAV4CD22_9GAST|nr:hypothetical protein PoB_005583000 [Plakobranchus ocellatus]
MPLSTHWGKNATPQLLRSFNDVRLKDAILVSHVDKVISYSSISTIGKNATPKLLRSLPILGECGQIGVNHLQPDLLSSISTIGKERDS